MFTFRINYNDPQNGATALYNGNISETSWKTANDNTERWYKYGYDPLNRVTSAIDNTTDQRYSLQSISYDKNGNIQNLLRKGHTNVGATTFGVMDDLTYSYDSGNKLMKVADAAIIDEFGFKDGTNTGNDYIYDINGNLLSDTNKGITNIEYNHLDLPTFVEIAGAGEDGNITYVYDATGVKLRKIVIDENTQNSTTTDYASNGALYENNVLQFIPHAEGYITPSGSSYDYVYHYLDHLGNIRLSYSDSDGNGTIAQSEIVEENNHYPFGLRHKGYNNNVSSNGNSVAKKFKYNGKELEEGLGLNLYEMDVRSYDPAIGRWTSIDPVVHYDFSTYNAFDNNPIFFADPSGADSWTYVNGSNGLYRNNQTGEETEDYQRAINETQAHFGDGTDDDKRVDSKTGKITITKTNDSQDRLFVDGKFVETAEQGSFEKELIENGTEFTYRSQPKAVGMGATDAALTYFSGEVVLSWLGKGLTALWASLRGSKLILNANWAQKTFSPTFGKLGKFSGQSIDDVSAALRSGKISPNDVPIDLIVREGQSLILNTRSSVALTRAGIPRGQWNVVNRTGQEFFENQLTNQLSRNKLTSAGVSTIRQSGTK